jgi:hypothetical protein
MKNSPAQTSTLHTLVALQETFWIALDTLRSHKLRTFLTLLGVMLAVTTLVAVMSVLNGLNLYIANKVANLGSNAFAIDLLFFSAFSVPLPPKATCASTVCQIN